jgi:hypothetical protein
MKVQDLIDKLQSLPESSKQLDIFENNEVWGLIPIDEESLDFEPKNASLIWATEYGKEYYHWILTQYIKEYDKIKESKNIVILYFAAS